MLHPPLARQFWTNNQNLHYNIITCTLMHCLQIQHPWRATSVHKYFPLILIDSLSVVQKSKEHEALSLLFEQDGMPPAMICYNAKELIQSKFNGKLHEVSWHIRQTEPFCTFSNAVKQGKKEGRSLKNNDQIQGSQENLRWLTAAWVMCQVKYCTWHL